MLKFYPVQNDDQKRQLISSLEISASTWVVSDLKSKIILQNIIMDQHNWMPQSAVRRVQELWSYLIKLTWPGVKLVSADYARALIQNWLKTSEYEWTKTAGAADQLFQFMTQLSVAIVDENHHESMGNWFRENPMSYVRWGEWYVEGLRIWSLFKESEVLPKSWVSGWLSTQSFENIKLNEKLYFDLGPDLSRIEVDLIKNISRYFDVTVVVPEFGIPHRYSRVKQQYGLLGANIPSAEWQLPDNFQALRFSTSLAEVKNAVAQVRTWIDSGTRQEDIAIIAPDIDKLWFVLKPHLSAEGIQYQKIDSQKIFEFPEILEWLSLLRLRSGHVRSADIISSQFLPESNASYRFEEFRAIYAKVYGPEDLGRVESVFNFINSGEYSISRECNRDQFIAWCVSQFKSQSSTNRLETIIKTFLTEVEENFVLDIADWVRLLSQISMNIEVGKNNFRHSGVHCLSIDASEDLKVKKALFLGLSESDLRTQFSTRLDPTEITSLESVVGCAIPYFDPSRLEYKIKRLALRCEESVLGYSETNIMGEVLAPSSLWLEYRTESKIQHDIKSSPGLTVWDSYQRSTEFSLSQLKNNSIQRLKEDNGWLAYHNEANLPEFSISASQIEGFLQCPFIFTARKLFALADSTDIDLDIDAMSIGRLNHKVLELAGKKLQAGFVINEDELIEQARQELKLILGEESSWSQIKSKLKLLLTRFIEFEKNWAQTFKNNKMLDFEVLVDGFFDLTTLSPVKNKTKNSIAIRGQVDRLDEGPSGELIILDYKRNKGKGVSQYTSWLENNKIQLLFYVWCIENGLTQYGPREVVGAFYYVLKDFERNFGFQVIDAGSPIVSIEDKSKNKITRSDKMNLIAQLQSKIKNMLEMINKGEIGPRPVKVDECQQCQWRQLCRYHEIN